MYPFCNDSAVHPHDLEAVPHRWSTGVTIRRRLSRTATLIVFEAPASSCRNLTSPVFGKGESSKSKATQSLRSARPFWSTVQPPTPLHASQLDFCVDLVGTITPHRSNCQSNFNAIV